MAAPSVGEPRPREAVLQWTYSPIDHEINGFNGLVLIVAFAHLALTLALLIRDSFRFVFLVIEAYIRKRKVANNPWGEGATTLERTVSSPSAFHEFEEGLPVIG